MTTRAAGGSNPPSLQWGLEDKAPKPNHYTDTDETKHLPLHKQANQQDSRAVTTDPKKGGRATR